VAELGIKGPLEYLWVLATTLVSLHMIPIACKITDFSLYLFVYFFENIIILVGMLCKEEWLAHASVKD